MYWSAIELSVFWTAWKLWYREEVEQGAKGEIREDGRNSRLGKCDGNDSITGIERD